MRREFFAKSKRRAAKFVVQLLRGVVVRVDAVESGGGRAVEVSVVLLVKFRESMGRECSVEGLLGLDPIPHASPAFGVVAPAVLVVNDVVPVTSDDGESGGTRGDVEFKGSM